MSKRILLTQGKEAIVDDADYERVNQWKWYAAKNRSIYYARRSIWENGKTRDVQMHRIILNAPPGRQVDHVNGDGLDNRHINLRLCTNSQNQMNRRKRANCSSIYKGVYWDSRRRRWKALIQRNGKQQSLGDYDSQREAAMAYDEAAPALFGEFALLNFTKETDDGEATE